MKKILGLIILSGFILMVGAAGSADVFGMSFVQTLLMVAAGMIVVVFGTSALMHYKRYVRKMMRKHAGKGTVHVSRKGLAARIHIGEKELC